jgi:acyl carrier protein
VPAIPAERITPDAALIDLEIDSLRVIELTLALETLLEQPVFLPDWIGGVEHPRELTVGSLARYIEQTRG